MSDGQQPIPGLTDRESAQLFNQLIRPTLTGTSREDPVAVWVGGPPGAGKSTVQSAVLARLGRQDAYPLDGDDLVAQHPRYLEMQRTNDLQAAYLASEDLRGRWWTRAARLLRAGKIDLSVSAPLAGPEWAKAQFDRFRESGYRNEAVFVATPEAQSLQGMVNRYLQARQPEQDAYGRWVLPEWHDVAHRGVLNTMDMIDQTPSVDAIHIARRDGTIIHTNERDETGQWRLQVASRQPAEAELSRQWTAQESAEFLHKQGRLREETETAPEWRPLLDEIDRRAAPVISPVTVLDRNQLDEQLGELAQAREQAVLSAEVAQVKASLLVEQQRSGDNERHLEELRQAGHPAEEVEQARTTINHDRWAASLSVGQLNRHVVQLAELNQHVIQEAQRRDAQPSQQRALEDRGRREHQAQRPEGDSPRLVPLPERPVVVRRESPRDPGPTKPVERPEAEASQHDAPGNRQATDQSPPAPPRPRSRSASQRLDAAYGGGSNSEGASGETVGRRRQPPPQPASSPGI